MSFKSCRLRHTNKELRGGGYQDMKEWKILFQLQLTNLNLRLKEHSEGERPSISYNNIPHILP